MSRVRRDYENTWWRKLVRFVNGESDIFSEKAGYKVETDEVKERLQKDFFEEVEWAKRKKESDELVEGYSDWADTKGRKFYEKVYCFLAVLICIGLIVLLLDTVTDLPPYANTDNPVNNEVSERYIEKGIYETGAVNIVAGMILDYRAFDTLGESHVLFVACICVMILLRIGGSKGGKSLESDRLLEPKKDPILRHIATILVPVIMLYGIYVVLNGHLSPGGGFSGGAIIGAGLILYLNAFGFQKAERFFTQKTFSAVSIAALLFYSCSKTYSFFTGANELHSIISPGTPGNIISAGLILPLNIAVGAVVACTMYFFYCMFRKGDL